MGKINPMFTDKCIIIICCFICRKILVAACEDESVVLYDASNQKCVHKIEKAHSNCVNCVR